MVDRAFALEMKAKVNDPRVRWAFEESEGKTDVEDERDVFGVLAKEKWVEKGGLDLLVGVPFWLDARAAERALSLPCGLLADSVPVH